MNIRIGDLVRFISEKLEGKVTGIVDQTTVHVYCDSYGFEIPASVNDLVVIHSDFARPVTAEKGVLPQPSARAIAVQSTDTLYLALVPDNFNNLSESRYELFIVNDTAQTCLFSVNFYDGEHYSGITAGNSNPGTTCPIGIYSLRDLDTRVKAVQVQAIFFQKGKTSVRNAIDTTLKIHPVNLCKAGSYKQSKWFNSVAMLRPLEKEEVIETEEIDEKQLQQALKEKKDNMPPTASRPQKQIVGNIVEIDLHSNELLETTAGMDSKDILEYQLDVFRKTLEEYKLRKGQKIIFIHGKGDGVLRQRILWELKTKYKRHHHQDASFKQYGYGATLVTIK